MTRQDAPVCAYPDKKIELPSVPIPGGSGYRLFAPFVGSRLSHLSEIDVVHAHSCFLAGLLARRMAHLRNVPWILTYHTMLDAYAHYAKFAAPLVRASLGAYLRWFSATAGAVTAPTQAAARHLRALGVQTRIEIVPSGIDTEAIDAVSRDASFAARLRMREGDALILCVARLGKEKNVRLVLEAFARLRTPATLVLAGDGPERRELFRLAESLGIRERIRHLGVCDRVELSRVYRACDVFAFASVTETQGLVLAEALYAGLPVVAVDTPQGREILEGSDARLVPADARQFAAAIDRAASEEDASAAVERRRQAGARYSRKATTARMATLYKELVKR